MPDDDLTAFLAMVSSDADQETMTHHPEDCADWRNSCSAHNAVRLAGMVRAVLELADMLPPQGPPSSALEEDRMWIREECADMIREAISRELTGKEESDE